MICTGRQSTQARLGDRRYHIPNPLFSELSTKVRLLPEWPNRTKTERKQSSFPVHSKIELSRQCIPLWCNQNVHPRNGIWLILWKIACVVIIQAPKCIAECRSPHSLMTSRIKFFHLQKSSLAVVETGKIKLQTLIVHRQVSGNSQTTHQAASDKTRVLSE